jgi:hypothetical protein
MRRDLEMIVMPELGTDFAKLSVTWVCEIIDYLLLEEHADNEVIAARDALLSTLPRAAATLNDRLPEVRDPHRAVDAIAASVRQTGPLTSLATIGAIGAISHRALAEEARFLEQRRIAAIE